jgi:hypothetical protein
MVVATASTIGLVCETASDPGVSEMRAWILAVFLMSCDGYREPGDACDVASDGYYACTRDARLLACTADGDWQPEDTDRAPNSAGGGCWCTEGEPNPYCMAPPSLQEPILD